MYDTVILTHGWTGSSVFSGLIARGGGWSGDGTVAKPDYDTFENVRLVELNSQLLTRFAKSLNHEHEFSDEHVRLIAKRARGADLGELDAFVALCGQHRPWVWKDPRLTWTIRVWADRLDLPAARFLVLTRETTQAWITANLRRHVQSLGFTRDYNDGITRSNLHFLQERDLPYLALSFEELLLEPERTLEQLNQHLNAGLTMTELQAVCKLPLGKRSRGLKDFMTAAAIYVKNYRERDGRARLGGRRGIATGAPSARL